MIRPVRVGRTLDPKADEGVVTEGAVSLEQRLLLLHDNLKTAKLTDCPDWADGTISGSPLNHADRSSSI